MVQVIQLPKSAKGAAAERIGDYIGQNLGQGLSQFTNTYFANKALDTVLNDETLKDAPQSKKMSALQRALSGYGETGMNLLKQRMEIDQQEQEDIDKNVIAKSLKGEDLDNKTFSKASPQVQFKIVEMQNKNKIKNSLKDAMVNAGVPEVVASQFSELYDVASEGGKTEIMKTINDQIRRGKLGDFNKQSDQIEEDIPDSEFPEIKEPKGYTEPEKARVYQSREKFNSPIYEDISKKVNGFDNELDAIHRLQQLDQTGKLPEGFQKWNINWQTGESRVPALLTPEAQLYVKTINDFTVKAKESFPGRVTNFDLQSFMRRLPTLANSREGRALITKQMEISTEIAKLKDETLRDVYDHYGLSISNQEAKKISNDIYKKRKTVLEDRLKDLDGALESKYQDMAQGKSETKRVNIITPNGSIKSIPEEMVDMAIKSGGKLQQ